MQASPERWLKQRGFLPQRITPLAGDVSARKYFRVRTEDAKSFILSSYPTELGKSYSNFVSVTTLLLQAGVRVPVIVAEDSNKEWMLLEDLGENNLFEKLPTLPAVEIYFAAAIETIDRFQSLPEQTVETTNPSLDSAALEAELEKTWNAFFALRAEFFEGPTEAELQEFLVDICQEIGSERLVPCHRDFMARNLIPVEATPPTLAVIDYQDLRLGPVHYDLASLLNDSFFPSEPLEVHLLSLAGIDEKGMSLYRKTAIQRTLKAVGTFAHFANQGSRVHLPLIPPTLRRTLYHLQALPKSKALAARLEPLWQAALQQFC